MTAAGIDAEGPPGSTDEAVVASARRRRLGRLAGGHGIVAGIALDHRDSLRVVLERQGIAAASDADLGALKHVLAAALAPAATAVMIDSELGGDALRDGAIPAAIGLIMPLEAQGYEEQGDRRFTTLLEDFSPLDALRAGADACKLLLPYRVDDEGAAAQQDALVVTTLHACHAIGVPLVVEPVVHRLSTETEADHADAYTTLVVEAVARLRPLGADLLKLPFPVHHAADASESDERAACLRLALACGDTPWVVLGGSGAGVDQLVTQIRLAGESGASGFLAGRAIWGPVLRPDVEETATLAATLALPAFQRCRIAAEAAARPLPGAAG